jgi:hypothetical protein
MLAPRGKGVVAAAHCNSESDNSMTDKPLSGRNQFARYEDVLRTDESDRPRHHRSLLRYCKAFIKRQSDNYYAYFLEFPAHIEFIGG